MNLKDKHVILGVTGGIAAYKAADLASKLTQAGALVDTIMTAAATQFVAPVTFQAVTGRPVFTGMFQGLAGGTSPAAMNIAHVEMARRAHLIIVAPATANTIAKLSYGLADELLCATILASSCPLLLAPAMESHMWLNPATQENMVRLRQRGVFVVGPGEGHLASGASGPGRMSETPEILDTARYIVGLAGALAGKRIVVTAGGTREPIDPVRYVGNRSSGKMGYALAAEARDRGATVTLVSGASEQTPPVGATLVSIETAAQMCDAVFSACAQADALVMAAAVADFRPESASEQKIKKATAGLALPLVRTVDILAEVSRRSPNLVKIGFAAESQDVLRNARSKLESKGLDVIAANDITSPGSGFGSDTNQVTLLFKDGHIDALPLMSKAQVAAMIMDALQEAINGRQDGRQDGQQDER
jgi:phosphopantothenoylcysteine decarboxylase / phosphopantothenate---cysteine ligase